MRVTNSMITNNTKNNINSNKVLVDKYNTQMTTEKKINKPSEDPVIAIRSLRMQTTLSHLDQYLDNNIEDVNSWLEITDTALSNIKSLLTDVRSLCVYGRTDQLKQDDRKTILNQLQGMAKQIYDEGNADYAGRTVFTGYRTTESLTFRTEEKEVEYTDIEQIFSYKDMDEHRYYYGDTEIPADAASTCTTEIGTNTYQRLRLAYDKVKQIDKIEVTNNSVSPATTTALGSSDYTVYETEDEWRASSGGMTVADDKAVFIKSTGELVLGKTLSEDWSRKKADIKVTYDKTGFKEGEARPEYYYNCKMKTPSMADPVEYKKRDADGKVIEQELQFVVSNGITMTANTQIKDVMDTSIARDIDEMINVVSKSINAHDKVDRIKAMMTQERYADETSQKNLQSYLDAANKEASYADDNLGKTYGQYITSFNGYLEKVNEAHTNVGSLQKRLSLTQTRVENQQTTVEQLKTNNDNRDISDIIIDYYAAYNAYTSSLTAAAKVGEQTLLNYL